MNAGCLSRSAKVSHFFYICRMHILARDDFGFRGLSNNEAPSLLILCLVKSEKTTNQKWSLRFQKSKTHSTRRIEYNRPYHSDGQNKSWRLSANQITLFYASRHNEWPAWQYFGCFSNLPGRGTQIKSEPALILKLKFTRFIWTLKDYHVVVSEDLETWKKIRAITINDGKFRRHRCRYTRSFCETHIDSAGVKFLKHSKKLSSFASFYMQQ